jgi:hypothetical protein
MIQPSSIFMVLWGSIHLYTFVATKALFDGYLRKITEAWGLPESPYLCLDGWVMSYDLVIMHAYKPFWILLLREGSYFNDMKTHPQLQALSYHSYRPFKDHSKCSKNVRQVEAFTLRTIRKSNSSVYCTLIHQTLHYSGVNLSARKNIPPRISFNSYAKNIVSVILDGYWVI